MKRLFNLDYLRGLAAFGIMLYHYTLWTKGLQSSADFLGRVGVYGVAIFYILSGLTLSYVYSDRLKFTAADLWDFAKKRIFRILPLLWLVTAYSIYINQLNPGFWDLTFNLTGLFGFFQWDKYFSVGLWSIGNEWVFYALFPVLVFSWRYKKWAMPLLMLLVLGCFVYFTFYRLNPSIKVSKQWHIYSNPLNQVYLFVMGFFLRFVFADQKVKNVWLITFVVVGLVVFVFFPVSGDQIRLVTGWNRVLFSLTCLLICWSFYKLDIKLPSLLHKPMLILGETSYSVYLLHPLVFITLNKQVKIWREMGCEIPYWQHCLAAAILTLVISYFVYNYFEKFFMNLGKR